MSESVDLEHAAMPLADAADFKAAFTFPSTGEPLDFQSRVGISRRGKVLLEQRAKK
jgi:hypothetical protein